MRSVVVIGAGAAGATISRVLSQRGVQVTQLEKASMTCAGATWHAAGLVTRFGGSSKLKKIHVRSLELMTALHDEEVAADRGGIGLHLPGSIRIIEKGNGARLLEAKQHVAMAALLDDPALPTRLISAAEVAALHPLLDASSVECGVWTPADGDVDPTSLTNCVLRRAKAHGATLRLNAEVTGVARLPGGGFRVHVNGDAEGGPLECDAVVNAAGLWSRGVSDLTGAAALQHPAFVIEHQYAITEALPAVKALAKAGHNGGRLPVLRDLAGSSYIRQEGDGFLVGPYEEDCVVRTDLARGPPADFEMELFPDALGRIEGNLLQAMGLVPCLGEVGFKSVVNGPTIWTGDSLARVGRSAVPGWFDFNSLTYGIAQSLGLAEYLAHVMLEGEQPPSFDASDYFDPLRYGAWATDAFVEAKIAETYARNNSVAFPYENRSAGRGALARATQAEHPMREVLARHGAKFGPYGGAGHEVPLCFVVGKGKGKGEAGEGFPGGEVAVEGDPGGEADFHDQERFCDFQWAGLAEAEAAHALRHVALSYSAFSRISVRGPGAHAFVKKVTTGAVPTAKSLTGGPGLKGGLGGGGGESGESGESGGFGESGDLPCRLTYSVTPKGRVQTEFTLCLEDASMQHWTLYGSRDHARQDSAWLLQCVETLGLRGQVAIGLNEDEDEEADEEAGAGAEAESAGNGVLHVCGPRSGELLCEVEPRSRGLGFMRAREVGDFAGVPGLRVRVMRVSFTGEMGFELHTATALTPQLHAALWASPAAKRLSLRHMGSAAVNSLRIEKGFKVRADLDFAHYSEAGIAPFVSKKRDFLGRDDGFAPKRQAAVFEVDTDVAWQWSVQGDSPVRRAADDAIVGFTTTSCRGASSGRTLALGYVDVEDYVTEQLQTELLYLDAFGFKWPARLLPAPPLVVNRDIFE